LLHPVSRDDDTAQNNTRALLDHLNIGSTASDSDFSVVRYLCSALTIRTAQLLGAGKCNSIIIIIIQGKLKYCFYFLASLHSHPAQLYSVLPSISSFCDVAVYTYEYKLNLTMKHRPVQIQGIAHFFSIKKLS
jgi:hypothetical protein